MLTFTDFRERVQYFSSIKNVTILSSATRLQTLLKNLKNFQISAKEIFIFEELSHSQRIELLSTTAPLIVSVSGQHTLEPYLSVLNRPTTFISESLCWRYLNGLLPIDFVPDETWSDIDNYVQSSKTLELLHSGFADNLVTLRSFVRSRKLSEIVVFETALALFFRSQLPELVPNFYHGTDYRCDVNTGETVVDCGACSSEYGGQFVSTFLEAAGSSGLVYAFEPIVPIYQSLDVELSHIFNVHLINAATWSHSTSLRMTSDGIASRCLSSEAQATPTTIGADSDTFVHAIALDEIFDERSVDFIKMDVEGAELASLRGATKVLRRDRPALSICIYHSAADFVQIPQYIHDLNLDYHMWIECNEGHVWSGMKLFAVPK